ncbi:ABC transporter permease [Bellilinea sp.]|uniref:ABC transporter permease n=1 Tax=Bellilinea sp. TaxID=2838785 RepID=UPI002ADE4EAB|nr:ABC transporter permease [Bellilinea sp.]
MMKTSSRWSGIVYQTLAVLLALLFTTAVMLISGANPIQVYHNIMLGAVGSPTKIADILVAWTPLLLATAGLLLTFTAGLWNIGIEGQITLGAIFTTWALRVLQPTDLPPTAIMLIGFLAGALGGMFWAGLVALLKIFGNVNEIFGGLGLNFVATALTIWLIFGPWKRPGVGSMSGTEPFPLELWLPTLPGFRLSPWSLALGIVAITLVYILLRGTYFGLRLKAVGRNGRAAFLMGIPTTRYMLMAFLLCGIMAGLAGATQVLAVYHRLIPSISSGYGFLGMMVAMLVNYQALWAAPVALFFAALNIGSIQLPIVLKLDSSLSGVLQGSLVLFVLLMDGVRRRLTRPQ